MCGLSLEPSIHDLDRLALSRRQNAKVIRQSLWVPLLVLLSVSAAVADPILLHTFHARQQQSMSRPGPEPAIGVRYILGVTQDGRLGSDFFANATYSDLVSPGYGTFDVPIGNAFEARLTDNLKQSICLTAESVFASGPSALVRFPASARCRAPSRLQPLCAGSDGLGGGGGWSRLWTGRRCTPRSVS